MKRNILLLILLPLCSFKAGFGDKIMHLKPYYHHMIAQDEPSDICVAGTDATHFYVAGNRGSIGEIDANGKMIRRSENDGSDYEGCCVKDGVIYALDESARRIDMISESDFAKFSKGTLNHSKMIKKSIYLHYAGPRNKGFEGITWNPVSKKFLVVTEKPCTIFELNDQMQVIDEVKAFQFKELSSVTYHDNFLYFLTDEGHSVMKCDPNDYSILQTWVIPVNNPEGICFDTEGNLVIMSDDMAELFKFKM